MCTGSTKAGNILRAFLLTVVLVITVFACSSGPSYPEAPIKGDSAVIDTSDLTPGEPLFLSHRYEGKCINFFIIKLEGRVMSFFDACETCYLQKKGFSHEPGYVTCRACGASFPVEDIETGVGSCYPIKLAGRTEGHYYIIELKDLRAHARKF